MPIVDDPKIMDNLKDIQAREGRGTKRTFRMLSDDELSDFLETGNLPEWAIEQALERIAFQEACDHAGWNWKDHGRCCFKCGAFVVDFGD